MSGSISESPKTDTQDEGNPTMREALEAAYDKAFSDKPEGETKPEGKSTAEAEAGAESETRSPEGAEAEVVPPEHWSDEDKQAFLKMDKGGRDWALRLEANYHKGIQEKSEKLKRFTEALEPYKPMLNGADEAQVIQRLLNAQAYLQRDPVNGVKWLMQSLKVDPTALVPKKEPEPTEFVDPEIKKLRDEVTVLRDAATLQQQQAVQQHQNAVFAAIAEFRDAVDEKGEKLHPHFGNVYGVMAGLLQSGRAADMEAAYNQAVWAVPEYRDVEVQKQIEARQKAEAEKKAREAEDAKKASKTVQGKQSAKSPTEPNTIRSALEEAYDKSVRGEL